MDEPSNHLDQSACAWLAKWLRNSACAVVLVSHDELLLESACTSHTPRLQNYGAPDTVPSLQLTAPGAAIAVLEALSKNGTPRHNHGLSVLYAFCGDIAPMDRSRFFGQSKDMFAMDHFQAACSQLCGPLINCRSFDVLRTVDQEDGRAHVVVNVLEGRGETSSEWVFIMRRSPAPSATEGWCDGGARASEPAPRRSRNG